MKKKNIFGKEGLPMREVLSGIRLIDLDQDGSDESSLADEMTKNENPADPGYTDGSSEKADQVTDLFGETEAEPSDYVDIAGIRQFLFLMLICCIACILIGSVIWFFKSFAAPDAGDTESRQFVVANQTEEETELPATDLTDAAAEYDDPGAETEGMWQDTVFGTEGANTITRRIRVVGPDREEIAGSGFSEPSFIKAAGQFLKEEGIGASQICFVEKAKPSADGAYAWRASIGGKAKYSLLGIWYKEYPGRFILTLVPEAENAGSDKNTADASTQASAQARQTQQQTPALSNVPPAESGQNTQLQIRQTERSYDATRLSIKGIPETLLNYISNRYELQYSLYDYLYHSGHRDVSSVQVTDYEIDPDRKEATIQLKADDGTSITGLYKRSGSSFSYRGG